MRRSMAAAIALGALAGCGSNSKRPGAQVSANISAAMGGSVALPDGTTVTFPPHALASDTMVTLSTPSPDDLPQGAVLGAISLDPDGLKLAQPATIAVHYDNSQQPDPADLALVVESSLNPFPQGTGEVDPFVVLDTATTDAGAPIMRATIDHFSWYSILVFPKLNIAPDLPGKFLLDGDLLYALTEAVSYVSGSAMPMHVGMYMEHPTPDRVIESTLPDSDCTPGYIEGVDIHQYEGAMGFKQLCGAHIFLGARRPFGATPEQGQAAVAAAQTHIGNPYGIIGLNWSDRVGFIAGGWSCASLVEDAWDTAGISITHTPKALLWPHAQLASTAPVRSIAINKATDGTLRIPIIVAVKIDKTHYTAGSESGPRTPVTLELTDDRGVVAAGRAKLDTTSSPSAVQDLVFTPGMEDVGEITSFSVTATAASRNATLTEDGFLRVFVTDDMPDMATPPGMPTVVCPAIQASCMSWATACGNGTTPTWVGCQWGCPGAPCSCGPWFACIAQNGCGANNGCANPAPDCQSWRSVLFSSPMTCP